MGLENIFWGQIKIKSFSHIPIFLSLILGFQKQNLESKMCIQWRIIFFN